VPHDKACVFLKAPILYFEIEDAKTPAGWRQVPIHSSLHERLSQLFQDSKHGYVLPGLNKDKYGDRSNAIGHRFGRLKTELGYNGQYVFHSIRKTVVTLLENAGVPENTVAEIVGHEKPGSRTGCIAGELRCR
jgi:integrase